MRPDEFLRKYGLDDESLQEREHSLQENARERALHPHRPNAGTPHDWEQWQKLREELGIKEDRPDPLAPTRNKHLDRPEDLEKPGWFERLKRLFRKA